MLARLTSVLALSFVCASLSACDGGDKAADEHSHDTEHTHETGTGETGETGETADCAAETRDDEFAIGLSKAGSGVTVTFVAADPSPPAMGDNRWTVVLTDPGGQPLPAATITAVTPIMPDHGHGTPVAAEISATNDAGEVTLDPVNLFMAGLWEITLDIDNGGAADQVVFAFCVE